MANGLLDLLGGLGTAPPSYLQGLLGENAVEDLRKRSIGSGLVNALIGYAAMPKNQNLGLGRILAGAAQSGMQGAQGVYQNATQDYLQAQQIAEMKRKQDQQARLQTMVGNIQDPAERLYAELSPQDYVKSKTSGQESPFAKINPKDFTPESVEQFMKTGGRDYSILTQAPEKVQTTEAIKNFEYARQRGYNGSFEDWAKSLTPYQLAQLGIDKAQLTLQTNEALYKYGTPPATSMPAPSAVTLQDIADTARAAGKTTQQVTDDFKKRGIQIQGVR